MSERKGRESPMPEYAGERDMDAFWSAVKPKKEPSKQKWYVPILIALVVFSVPWYRGEGQMGTVVLGFPTWIWTSLICSLGVAIMVAIGILAFWNDDAD